MDTAEYARQVRENRDAGRCLSFHVSTRCGLRPNARQIRDTADCDMPCDLAIDRVDQRESPRLAG